MPRERELTPRQAAFVREYLLDLNATQAAIRAGYSPKTARDQCHRFLRNPLVREAVQAALGKTGGHTGITRERILEELALIAFGDLREAAEWGADGVRLKESSMLTREEAAAIREISVTVTGTGGSTKVKRQDKVKALELLMRHHGMLNDKIRVSGEIDLSELEKGRERAKRDFKARSGAGKGGEG